MSATTTTLLLLLLTMTRSKKEEGGNVVSVKTYPTFIVIFTIPTWEKSTVLERFLAPFSRWNCGFFTIVRLQQHAVD